MSKTDNKTNQLKSNTKDVQYLECVDGKEPPHHKNCFQWGSVVYCHDCKKQVATSYVQKYFKKPIWLTEEEIKQREEIARLE